MPGFILTQSSIILCPHGGVVNHIPITVTEFKIEGHSPLLLTDQYLVAGCANFVGGMARPCLNVIWINPSTMLFVQGFPALTNISTPLVQDSMGAPTGTAVVTSFQTSYPDPPELTQVN